VLQIAAVAMPLLGYRMVLLLIMPLGISHLLRAFWLMAEGFQDPGSCGAPKPPLLSRVPHPLPPDATKGEHS
jgi:hypothetical protein